MTTSPPVRPASISDLPALADLEFRNMSLFFGNDHHFSIESVSQVIAEHISRAWVIPDVIPHSFYYWEPDDGCAVLLSIQVAPAHRGRGHGSELLAHFEAQASAAGSSELGLAVHTANPAYAWYLRHGYTFVDVDGPDCHVLLKTAGP
jgi:ribosomal protein S18 acetylase RimI-like enzyme